MTTANAEQTDSRAPVRDDGWRIPDTVWTRVVELLPPGRPHPLGCHNPRVPDRRAMDAILLVARGGCTWNGLSRTGICSSSSAHRRFLEWDAAGVLRIIRSERLLESAGMPSLDWDALARKRRVRRRKVRGAPAPVAPSNVSSPKPGRRRADVA